ncbi:MAG: IS1 family transposase [Bryobacteraceae bacterium]|jgi:IS1 family transposase
MNRLDAETRCRVIASLVEGNSIRATVRMTGAAKNTVAKLLVELGEACAAYQDRVFHSLACKRVQVDECWAFCYAKQKNVTAEIAAKNPFAGDVWTWAAIDADTKLIPSWIVGPRDGVTARIFVSDLAGRLADRIQLTSDGLNAYLNAVERAFRGDVDYAQLVKVYGDNSEGQKRYSPPECISCERKAIVGYPDPGHVSTSFIERANLTMRMGMRRFTRLTNGFSKKIENHTAAIALHMMHYNFVRIHQTIRVTPAMAAGVTTKLWEIADIVALLDQKDSN